MEENSPNTTILYFGTNNLKSNEVTEDLANDRMNLSISLKTGKKTAAPSGLTTQNDELNNKGKNLNSLLKQKYDEEKQVFVKS